MPFEKLKKWTSVKGLNTANVLQPQEEDTQHSQSTSKTSSGEQPYQRKSSRIESPTSSISSTHTTILCRRGIDEVKQQKLRVNTNVKPPASLPALTRCEVSNQYLNPDFEAFAEEDVRYNDAKQATSTRSPSSVYSNEHPKNSESTTVHDEVDQSTVYHNTNHGFDFGFNDLPIRLSPTMSPIWDEDRYQDAQDHLSANSESSYAEDEDEEVPMSAKGHMLRKAAKLGFGVDQKIPKVVSEESIMTAYSRSLDRASLAHFLSLDRQEMGQIIASKGGSNESDPQSLPSDRYSDKVSSISDQVADAMVIPIHTDSTPPIPRKSSRRRLASRPFYDTANITSAPTIVETPSPKVAATNTSNNETKQDNFSFHLLYHDTTKPANRPSSTEPSRLNRTFPPPRLPKPPPEILAAEARIAVYKASLEYIQRNKDLVYINQQNYAKKLAVLDDSDSEDDTKTVAKKPSEDVLLLDQAMDRITEMSVNGRFRAFLKDMTFVRMYRDEVKVRAERGVWWEGWIVLEELRGRGVVPSMKEYWQTRLG